jgi:2-polyprenyl-3-methyl-5-hydroxy-6-metoxy-1,4-benzoquinol methylase
MCTACATVSAIDTTKVDAFGRKMLAAINGSALMLMTSIGHRTGLFDTMADAQPRTSLELANDARLNERYVREWLGTMVTGGVVLYDAPTKRYHLPAEHAAVLTRASSPNNMAVTAQWVSVLGYVEDNVVEAFKHGKGVPYSAYHRFHEVMAEESNQTTCGGLFNHILPAVPGLLRKLETGIEALDIACGSGMAVCALAEAFPASTFSGFDVSTQAIKAARAEAERRGLTNANFVVRDVSEDLGTACYDLITGFDAIHDQGKPAQVLRNICKALKKEGTFLMQDIYASSHVEQNVEHPLGPFLYAVSTMHCMSVSLANGGPGLGAAWGKELALQMLVEAGFGPVDVQTLPHDIINYYYMTSPKA